MAITAVQAAGLVAVSGLCLSAFYWQRGMLAGWQCNPCAVLFQVRTGWQASVTGPEPKRSKTLLSQDGGRAVKTIERLLTIAEGIRCRQRPTWGDLIRLYERDQEAFYELALSDPGDVPAELVPIQRVARLIYTALYNGYSLIPPDDVWYLAANGIKLLHVSRGDVDMVRHFLRIIDGRIHTGGDVHFPGLPFGPDATESEVRFKMREKKI